MIRMALIAALLLLIAPGLSAAEVRFVGHLTQGWLAIGHAEPGSSIAVNAGRCAFGAGEFLLGFDRDAPSSVTLTITDPAGVKRVQTVAVARRDFPVQRVDGLPPQQVSPDAKTLKRINEEAALVAAAKAKDTATPFFRSGFAWPVAGRLSGVYGSQRILNGEPRAPHAGLDIRRPRVPGVHRRWPVSLVEGTFFTGRR